MHYATCMYAIIATLCCNMLCYVMKFLRTLNQDDNHECNKESLPLCILGYAADLAVVEASSVYASNYQTYGPEQALTEISTNHINYWHSAGEDNPSITFKMQQTHEVLHVEVADRQDCCNDRFTNVEVRIGSTPSFGNAQSCGVQSYNGKTTYKYNL